MEGVASDVEAFHLGLADLDAFLVGPCIERTFDLETGLRCGCGDQIDHGGAICERPASPVLRDVTKHPVFDLVPLGSTRRIVEDLDGQPRPVGELLQFDFPQPHARAIRAAAIGGYRQLPCLGIAPPAHFLEPGGNGRHSELGGVVRDPYPSGEGRLFAEDVIVNIEGAAGTMIVSV